MKNKNLSNIIQIANNYYKSQIDLLKSEFKRIIINDIDFTKLDKYYALIEKKNIELSDDNIDDLIYNCVLIEKYIKRIKNNLDELEHNNQNFK